MPPGMLPLAVAVPTLAVPTQEEQGVLITNQGETELGEKAHAGAGTNL